MNKPCVNFNCCGVYKIYLQLMVEDSTQQCFRNKMSKSFSELNFAKNVLANIVIWM